MSFSASTCITNTGTTELGPTLFFYSDVTGFGDSFGSDSTENLVGDNCPYIMENIPYGTTIVRIIDPVTNCGVDIVLQSSDLCNICNLNFDVYETNTVSQIVVGNLVGSCDDDISDYIINWYGPGEGSTNLAFTSGYGTEFANIGWDNTHPLTGSSSPLIQAGVYTPVIDRVIVNDVAYSTTGAPGTYVANLNCFNSSQVTVDALRCDNGNNVGDYSHHFLFENVSVGNPPESLSASFLLSANTNYLAWKFRGFDVVDTLKLTFYGDSYNDIPIVIENIRLGDLLTSSDLSPNATPKRLGTGSFFAKVTCLTGFTISEGDYITIEITPNPANNNTKWDFYFECLENFDCSSCLDNHSDSPYKILLSTVESTLVSCNRNQIYFQLTGCTNNQLSVSDTYKYFNTGYDSYGRYNDVFSPQSYNNIFYFDRPICEYIYNNFAGSTCGSPYTNCSPPSSETIIYSKTIENGEGLISMKFSSFDDFNHYYQSYILAINTTGVYYDNTQYNFYSSINLKLPVPQNENEICGDTTIYNTYTLHPTTVVTTGFTDSLYEMTMTMPTITQGIFPTACELGCSQSIDNFINSINQSSLSTTNNFTATTNVGSKYQKPFFCVKRTVETNSGFSGKTYEGFFYILSYANKTYPYSGQPITYISSLSAQTCNFDGNSVTISQTPQFTYHIQYVYLYRVEIFDPNDVTNFRIYGCPINNFQYSGSTTSPSLTPIYELALEYSGGTITYQNPYYCI